MSDEQLLQEYSQSILRLRKQFIDSGLSEEEFRRLYNESLESVVKEEYEVINRPKSYMSSKLYVLIIAAVIGLVGLYNCQTVYSCLVCNLQEYIYPGLRLLRKLSIPLISLFPSLTDLYHETCLIQNPFFTVVDMDCWPCSNIISVQQIYDPKPVNEQHRAPFIYETDQHGVDFKSLKKLYLSHKEVLDRESPKVFVDNRYYSSAHDLFSKSIDPDNVLYIWKINTMGGARILRQIIPRPKVVPKFGQSTERFLIIDSSQKSFQIPDTECSYSFLMSLNGSRMLQLRPAEECKHQCKSLNVELKENYLLWYNWWYWRPVVQQSNTNNTFIAHVGSYC